MALKYADLCTRCGARRTRHHSGLCCRCRAVTPSGTCRICGEATRHGAEYCHKCRKRLPINTDLDSAISVQQQRLRILQLRKAGMSFTETAEAVGLSRSKTYELYRDMMHIPGVDMSPESMDVLLQATPEEDEESD